MAAAALFSLVVLPLSAQAQEGGVVVFAKLVEGPLPTEDLVSPLWQQARAVEFPLSAQVHWEPRIFSVTAKSVKVRALHNGEDLAILIEYQDPTKGDDDAAAVQFPVGDEKAHFAHAQRMLQMESGSVNIWHWKEGEVGDLNAKGFGNLRAQDRQDVTGFGVWNDGVWRVVFQRKLQTDDEKDAQIIPGEFLQIAFAIWDSDNGETGSKKAVSSWWYFRAEPPADPTVWIYSLIAVAGAALFEVVLIKRLKKRSADA